MKQNLLPVAASALLLLSASCSDVQTASKEAIEIQKPVESISSHAETFSVHPDEPTVLELKSKSKLHIPSNAFVNAAGQTITEPVEIAIEEYRTIGEIIASGIPMTYDSAGTTYNFESAGMFKVTGTSNGEEIFVADGVEMHMEMFSDKIDGNFSTYELSKENGKWSNIGQHTMHGNKSFEECAAISQEIKDLFKPQMPGKPSKNAKIISIDAKDVKNNPMAAFEGVMWEYLEDEAQGIEFASLGNDWICYDLELKDEEDFTFNALMENKKSRGKVVVKPVLTGRNHENAKSVFAKLLSKFKSKKKQLKDRRTAALVNATVYRGFSLKGFGIYNYDRCFNPGLVSRKLNFEYEGAPLLCNNYYLVEGTRNMVKYDQYTIEKFTFTPELDCKIVAVMNDGSMAFVSTKEFDEQIRKSGSRSRTVAVEMTKEKLTDSKQIDALLATI